MLLSELARNKKQIFQFENNILVLPYCLIDFSFLFWPFRGLSYCLLFLSDMHMKMNSAALTSANNDDDDEEKFLDAKSDDDDESAPVLNREKPVETKANKVGNQSWIHKKNIIYKFHNKYDYTQRNPLYSGADQALTYELLLYSRHYHPTVSLFASKLMNVIFYTCLKWQLTTPKPLIDRNFELFLRLNTLITVVIQCKTLRQFTFWIDLSIRIRKRTRQTKTVSGLCLPGVAVQSATLAKCLPDLITETEKYLWTKFSGKCVAKSNNSLCQRKIGVWPTNN
jgi:hypothetical protein